MACWWTKLPPNRVVSVVALRREASRTTDFTLTLDRHLLSPLAERSPSAYLTRQ